LTIVGLLFYTFCVSTIIQGVFFEEVDRCSHTVGTNGVLLLDIIQQVDYQLARIQTILETTRFPDQTSGSMFDRVNMAVFSDHGMTKRFGDPPDKNSGVISLFDYVNRTDYNRTMGSKVGSILSIWPNDGEVDWVG